MPYVSAQQVAASLDYLSKHTHPFLISVLAAFRAGVVVTDGDEGTVRYGGADETSLLDEYSSPAGAPALSPFYVPFGLDQGKSRWRDRDYAGSSLQRQRQDRSDIVAQHTGDRTRWRFQPGLEAAIKTRPKRSVGDLPVSLTHLGVWLFRTREIAALDELAPLVASTFKLPQALQDEGVFTPRVPPVLADLPLSEHPVAADELLQLLQAPPLAKPKARTAGDWTSFSSDALEELDELRGAERAARRALAALQAGMHVVLTGAPGTGKTRLATLLLDRAGFPYAIAPATDQWTTFETIGGYFPQPDAGEGLDFLPGVVVSAIEEGRCLIIDELNRADIDKAFGELFTLLAGSAVSLPYRKRSGGSFKKIRIAWEAGPPADDTFEYVVPPWWRIVGTMNDADKASLKRLSLAFIRRFAFVPLEVPESADYAAIIEDACGDLADTEPLRVVRSVLVTLFADDAGGLKALGFPIGPAIPLAMLRHAAAQVALTGGANAQELVSEVLTLYLAPQLQGRPDLHTSILSLVQPHVGAEEARPFAHNLAVWTGFAE